MPIPVQSRINDALLVELFKAGGSSRARDIYDRVAAHFPEMTAQERAEELENWGTNRFNNKVQWSRQALVSTEYIDGSIRGVWTLTPAGQNAARQLISQRDESIRSDSTPQPTLLDLLDAHTVALREAIDERLRALDAYQFEALSGRLLRAMGFRDVVVTQKSADGGIDGHGKLRVGIVSVNAAFQCKKWRAVVHRPTIDQFRGATQGRFDQAILMTTSTFSDGAIAESIRPSVIPIILVDGPRMVDLMIESDIGTTRRPLTIAQLDEAFFAQLGDGPHVDEL